MIERKIIISLITSTEYCRRVKDIWNIQLLESPTAKRIAAWVWEYFQKYDRAPGRDIEPLFYSKLRSGRLPKALAEEIEQDILPGLSSEYEKDDLNLDYLLEETEKYLNERYIHLFTGNVESLITTGRLPEAEKMVREFRPLGSLIGKLDDFILTAEQIRRRDRPHPTVLMKSWLKEGQGTILYANYGSGKTLLTILIAYVLGLKDGDREECEIGEWIVKHPCGTLYIDGEMGENEMEERVRQFEWLGKQPPERRLRILSVPEYQLQTEDIFYLSDRATQSKIIRWLKEHSSYKLVILDSASTLFGLEDENSNSEWNRKINPFLRDLRALGTAYILLHHSGKSDKKGLRGASAMGAMAHNIFRLKDHEGRLDGEAWFIVSKDKQRSKGHLFKNFALRFSLENEDRETHWEVTELH